MFLVKYIINNDWALISAKMDEFAATQVIEDLQSENTGHLQGAEKLQVRVNI